VTHHPRGSPRRSAASYPGSRIGAFAQAPLRHRPCHPTSAIVSVCIRNGHNHRATNGRSFQPRRAQRQTVLAGGRPFNERRGVCRDYAHLAVAFCRCLERLRCELRGGLGREPCCSSSPKARKQFLVGPELFGNFHVESVARRGELGLGPAPARIEGFDHEKSFCHDNHRHRDFPACCS
jgi:hypothetical protein